MLFSLGIILRVRVPLFASEHIWAHCERICVNLMVLAPVAWRIHAKLLIPAPISERICETIWWFWHEDDDPDYAENCLVIAFREGGMPEDRLQMVKISVMNRIVPKCKCVHLSLSLYIYIYIYIYIRICIHTYIHVHTSTHIYTHVYTFNSLNVLLPDAAAEQDWQEHCFVCCNIEIRSVFIISNRKISNRASQILKANMLLVCPYCLEFQIVRV